MADELNPLISAEDAAEFAEMGYSVEEINKLYEASEASAVEATAEEANKAAAELAAAEQAAAKDAELAAEPPSAWESYMAEQAAAKAKILEDEVAVLNAEKNRGLLEGKSADDPDYIIDPETGGITTTQALTDQSLYNDAFTQSEDDFEFDDEEVVTAPDLPDIDIVLPNEEPDPEWLAQKEQLSEDASAESDQAYAEQDQTEAEYVALKEEREAIEAAIAAGEDTVTLGEGAAAVEFSASVAEDILKTKEKAEAELIKAKNMFSDMLPPARKLMDKEMNSFFNYKRDHNSDVKRHNSNYTTEAEQHWENFKSSVNGSIVYSIGNVQKTIQQTKNSLKDLLKIV